jgi:hypothetical protein
MSTLTILAASHVVTAICCTGAAAAEPESFRCVGLSVGEFERSLPADIGRVSFEQPMIGPFVDFWNADARPDLPFRPERVTLYAPPGINLMIGFERRRCVFAVLTVDGALLWRWLQPRIGWQI